MKRFQDMTDDEFRDELKKLVNSSRSEEEIRQGLLKIGCPWSPCIHSITNGFSMMAMVMTNGPSGAVISV